jgi:cell division septation protein DedD
MQMNVTVDAQTIDPLMFYLTGKQPGGGKDALAGKRPALLAAYGDLTRLRYDFPLVLTEGKTDGVPVRSLSSVIDNLLQKIASPGMESEQLRKMILRIEREIRTLAAAGESGHLSELWDKVAARFEEADAAFGKSVRIARAALEIDGTVLDCRPGMASSLIGHLWSAVQENKAQRFRAIASRLAVKLADILRADYLRSAAGRSAESLLAAIGPVHQALFDFAAMSKLLPKSSPREALSEDRRRRIESALAVLKGQRFFAPAAGQTQPDRSVKPYSFQFDNCAEAISAYRARVPDLVELVKAMSIAELESEGTYIEAKHDVVFFGFDAGSLSPRDTALFPDYLVVLDERGSGIDNTTLMAAFSSELPLKILLDVADLFEETMVGNGHAPSGLRSAQLASLVSGLGEVFVLQSTSSNLYQLRDRIKRGLSFSGPALFSVYSGVPAQESSLPPYLSAAAAMQSRAFPAFSYDPSAGADMASRFSLENNPQPDADWAIHSIEYADPDMQRVKQEIAFTFLDFLVCDDRHHSHFAAVPHGFAAERMVPAAQWIASSSTESSDSVPYVLTAGSDNVLSRSVADDRVIGAARRCLENWHRLQESGGVHNSHAERLLKRERQVWEEQKRQELASQQPVAAPTPAVVAPSAATPTAAAAESAPAAPERNPDEAYIETERCTSCNECTLINDRMFAYNANKQAFIADPGAGTYRQLVEAAESCQVAIIHPGKPRNSNEAGLNELIKRAASFR